MTPDLKTLRSLCEAATPGPWRLRTNRHETTDGYPWGWVSENTDRNIDLPNVRIHWERDQGRANAAFIAAANPQAILSLLDRVEALEGALASIHSLAQDQSGSRTFDGCSTALMRIDDLCRALNPTGVGEAG